MIKALALAAAIASWGNVEHPLFALDHFSDVYPIVENGAPLAVKSVNVSEIPVHVEPPPLPQGKIG